MATEVKTICVNSTSSTFPDAYLNNPVGSASNVDVVSDKTNMQLSSVFACMQLPAETVAALPFGVYKIGEDGGMTRDRSHQLDYMISMRPWPTVPNHEFMSMIIMSMHRKGYACVYVHRNDYHEPIGLEFIEPEEVGVFANEQGNDFRITISRYPDAGKNGVIDPNDHIFIRNFSFNGIDGESTLWYAMQATNLSRSAEKTAREFFSSGASISGYISTDQKLMDSRVKDLKASWRQNYGRGVGSNADIPVLDGGMKFNPVTVKPSDAQLLESRKYNAVDICRFFLMPPTKIYAGENKYNSQEQETLSYLSDKIIPLIDKIEQEFTHKLIPVSERGKYEIHFDEMALIKGDMKAMSEFYPKMISSAVFAPDDVRRDLKKPTDPSQGGGERFMMANQIPLKMAVKYWEKNADNITVGAKKEQNQSKENEGNPEN